MPSWITFFVTYAMVALVVFKQRAFVFKIIIGHNHYMSQLFKMAAPKKKIVNQNKPFWNWFISDTNSFIGKMIAHFWLWTLCSVV